MEYQGSQKPTTPTDGGDPIELTVFVNKYFYIGKSPRGRDYFEGYIRSNCNPSYPSWYRKYPGDKKASGNPIRHKGQKTPPTKRDPKWRYFSDSTDDVIIRDNDPKIKKRRSPKTKNIRITSESQFQTRDGSRGRSPPKSETRTNTLRESTNTSLSPTAPTYVSSSSSEEVQNPKNTEKVCLPIAESYFCPTCNCVTNDPTCCSNASNPPTSSQSSSIYHKSQTIPTLSDRNSQESPQTSDRNNVQETRAQEAIPGTTGNIRWTPNNDIWRSTFYPHSPGTYSSSIETSSPNFYHDPESVGSSLADHFPNPPPHQDQDSGPSQSKTQTIDQTSNPQKEWCDADWQRCVDQAEDANFSFRGRGINDPETQARIEKLRKDLQAPTCRYIINFKTKRLEYHCTCWGDRSYITISSAENGRVDTRTEKESSLDDETILYNIFYVFTSADFPWEVAYGLSGHCNLFDAASVATNLPKGKKADGEESREVGGGETTTRTTSDTRQIDQKYPTFEGLGKPQSPLRYSDIADIEACRDSESGTFGKEEINPSDRPTDSQSTPFPSQTRKTNPYLFETPETHSEISTTEHQCICCGEPFSRGFGNDPWRTSTFQTPPRNILQPKSSNNLNAIGERERTVEGRTKTTSESTNNNDGTRSQRETTIQGNTVPNDTTGGHLPSDRETTTRSDRSKHPADPSCEKRYGTYILYIVEYNTRTGIAKKIPENGYFDNDWEFIDYVEGNTYMAMDVKVITK